MGRSLLLVIVLSFCSQAVQLSALPALIALRLSADGWPATVLGVVAAAPWIAVLLVGGQVPRMLSGGRHAWVNGLALALSAVALLAFVTVRAPVAVFAANLCLGVGLILRWIACDSWIIALAPAAIRGRVIGLHETLMGGAFTAGPILIAVFGSRTSAPLFACLGLLLVGAGALLTVGRYVPVQPEENKAPVRTEAGGIVSLMTAAALLSGFVETACLSLLPVLSQKAGWPLDTTWVLGAFAVGSAVAQLPVGHLADRFGPRRCQLVTAAVLVAIGMVLLAPSHLTSSGSLLVALFLLGAAAGSMITLAIIEGGSLEPERVATANSRIALAYTLGSILGPPLLGVLASQMGPAWFPVAFAAAAALFCAAHLRAGRPSAQEAL